jgi:CubicO group peptidase (beta-lactamase class C family)
LPQDKVGSYHYSDVNYVLLAGIIKKVSHKSYAWNFKKRVVQRLGLKSTYVSSQLPKNKMLAVSYTYKHGKNYQQERQLWKRHGCLSWLGPEHADDSQRLLFYPRSFGDRAVPVAERLSQADPPQEQDQSI